MDPSHRRKASSLGKSDALYQDSLKLIAHLYVRNGYPKSFVNSTIKRTLRKSNVPSLEQEQDNYTYIKVPYINEDLKRQTQDVIKRTGLNNIRVIYMNGRSSASIFTPPKEKQQCPDNCDTCSTALVNNRCLTKNSVYKIQCLHCHLMYIGESSRTIRSRLKNTLQWRNKQFTYIYLHIIILHL